jgi:hypothetical protein
MKLRLCVEPLILLSGRSPISPISWVFLCRKAFGFETAQSKAKVASSRLSNIGIRYGLIESVENDIPSSRAVHKLDASGSL